MSERWSIQKYRDYLAGRCPPALLRYGGVAEKAEGRGVVVFTVPGQPISKPRQTQSDKWAKRPRVVRYRLWCDRARLCAPDDLTRTPESVHVLAYLSIPKSLSEKERERVRGRPHRAKPDADNILKAVCDALFPHDQMIHDMRVRKFWEDLGGPRVVVFVV